MLFRPQQTLAIVAAAAASVIKYISLSRKQNEESWTGVGTGSALNRKRQSSSFN